MLCIGNEISLRINGEVVSTVPLKNNVYSQGQAGFNISSINVFPIDIRMIEFEVSDPALESAAAGSTLTSAATGTADTP